MSHEPPTPRPAATVILVRREGNQPSVYLLRRSPRSGFMGGLYVFPGGTVETQDRLPDWYRHVDVSPRRLEDRFGGEGNCDEILAYLVAAIRETLEEAGVLLGQRPGAAIGGSSDETCRRRFFDDPSPQWFLEEVANGDWRLAVSNMYRWARWITPEQMRRRFDTRFFLAVMPEGRQCRPDGRETVHGLWATPRSALEANLQGRTPLSPPTLMTLQALLQYPTCDSLLRAGEKKHWGEAKMPRLVRLQHGERIILAPWDPDYQRGDIDIDPRHARPLAPGVPFSRILLCDGVWRPIAVTG